MKKSKTVRPETLAIHAGIEDPPQHGPVSVPIYQSATFSFREADEGAARGGGGDRVQTRAEISKLHQRLETTFIYVTHDQTEAMTMGSRICVLRDGIMMQIDTPQNLYDKPDNVFVGGFIGSPAMNLFEVELSSAGDAVSLQAGDFTLELPHEKAKHFQDYTERKVIVGIRPEDFKRAAEHSPGQTIPATVEVVEPIGNETYVNVTSGNVMLTAAVGRRTKIEPHSTINLIPIFENMHLFDCRSEKSIIN